MYQINYIYYFDLPEKGALMCEKHKVNGKEYADKKAAETDCKDLNHTNTKKDGKFVVKPLKNGTKA